MRLLLPILAILLLGCGSSPATSRIPSTGNSIARAQALGDDAQGHVEAVLPHVSGDDKVHLVAADSSLIKQAGNLVDAQTSDADTNKQIAEKDKVITQKDDRIYQLDHQVFSTVQKRFALWIVGIGLSVWLCLGLLSFYGGGIGQTILHLLPFANPFAWFKGKFLAR